MSNFPQGYQGYAPGNEAKFSESYLNSIKKNNTELQNFFDCAIKDDSFWDSQNFETKQRIFKIIEESNNPELTNICIQKIQELTRENFTKFFFEVNNQDIISLFAFNQKEITMLSKESLEEILSFSSYIEDQSRGSNSIPQNSHPLINFMLSKKYNKQNIIKALDKITIKDLQKEEFNKENLL